MTSSDSDLERLLSELVSEPEPRPPLTVGARVADRFLIRELRGAGGMGRVYRAEDQATARMVALKIAHVMSASQARRTASLLLGSFDVHQDGELRLLVGERRQLAKPRLVLGRQTPCVGRRKELALLLATLEECIEEPMARTVLVTGAPGLGKSRLALELSRRAESSARVLVARGDALGAGSPLALARQLVRSALGIPASAAPAEARALLARYASRHPAREGEAWTRDFVGELAGVVSADPGASLDRAKRDALTMGRFIERAMAHVVVTAAAEGPLLLILEDVHWADASSLGLLRRAMREATECPLMVLALARPEIDDAHPDLAADPDVQRLRLSALSAGAVKRLAQAVLDDVDERTLREILERASGNGLFAEELIRRAASGGSAELPDTVLAVIEARGGTAEKVQRARASKRGSRCSSAAGDCSRPNARSSAWAPPCGASTRRPRALGGLEAAPAAARGLLDRYEARAVIAGTGGRDGQGEDRLGRGRGPVEAARCRQQGGAAKSAPPRGGGGGEPGGDHR